MATPSLPAIFRFSPALLDLRFVNGLLEGDKWPQAGVPDDKALVFQISHHLLSILVCGGRLLDDKGAIVADGDTAPGIAQQLFSFGPIAADTPVHGGAVVFATGPVRDAAQRADNA